MCIPSTSSFSCCSAVLYFFSNPDRLSLSTCTLRTAGLPFSSSKRLNAPTCTHTQTCTGRRVEEHTLMQQHQAPVASTHAERLGQQHRKHWVVHENCTALGPFLTALVGVLRTSPAVQRALGTCTAFLHDSGTRTQEHCRSLHTLATSSISLVGIMVHTVFNSIY